MERKEFAAEGKMEICPSAQFFVFLDGDYLGQQLVSHCGLPEERGYTDLGVCASRWSGWGRTRAKTPALRYTAVLSGCAQEVLRKIVPRAAGAIYRSTNAELGPTWGLRRVFELRVPALAVSDLLAGW